MSDIEDGELLSSENEENFTNPRARKEAKKQRKTKYKDKNHLDTNNNLQNNLNEQRNFPRNNEIRHNKIRNTNALRPHFNERKRNGHHKVDVEENKKKPRFEPKEKVSQEYCSPIQTEFPSAPPVHPEIPVIPKRQILCKYYAGGECKNGTACVYMHEDFPCKFFHDKSSICRAGSDCKYSHKPLSDHMQIIMDYFIQEGKEHKPVTGSVSVIPSYNSQNTVHHRTKCLLSTPTTNISQQHIGQPLNNSNFIVPDHEELIHERPKPFTNTTISNYRLKYSDPIVPGICHPNKSRNVSKSYLPKQMTSNYQKKPSEYYIKHLPQSADSGASISYENPRENYVPDFYMAKPEPIALMDIDFREPPPCEIGINPPLSSSLHLSYNTHAPARFIIRNNNNNFSIEKPVEEPADKGFLDAIKKLAAQIISEPAEIPKSPENQMVDASEAENSPKHEIKDEPLLQHPVKQENVSNPINPILESITVNKIKRESAEVPTVRIAENTSIFNIDLNEMSESDKQYIDEMKSLINFDAQFETTVRWVAVQLEPIEKQPYILYRLNWQAVHENAASDPRLIGHPVLRELENQNDSDEEDVSQNSCNTSEGDDDYDIFQSKTLNIDLGMSDDQSGPKCDSRSYLYDCKYKRKKISEHIIL